MKYVLGFDPGYGDDKVIYGDARGNIFKIYKFNSVLGRVDLNENVTDKRVYNYQGGNYYVGQLALQLESSRIIDLLTYPNLEKFAPLLVKYTIDQLQEQVGEIPSVIVCGLSIAHMTQSGHFKNALHKYLVEEQGLPIEKIVIIPQGIGGKIAYDKYGASFPNINDEFTENANYVGCDIGFNTLDIFQVLQGKTTPNLIKGIENQGVVKVVAKLLSYIQEKYQIPFTIKEGKEILDKGSFRVRGNEFDVMSIITDIKKDYLNEIRHTIETNFGAVLNKVDKIRMFGGGSYIFKDLNDPFIEIPETRAEYYNALGNYWRGIELVQEA